MHTKNIGKSQETLIFKLRIKNALIGVKYWTQEENCITLKQIHSDIAVKVDKQSQTPEEGDALVTSEPIRIGIKTADCVPIILVGNKDVAAIHAGWRGLKKGIIQNTIKLMQDNPKDIFAFLGPSAKACCYEVDPSFKEVFKIITFREGKFYMDTQKEALMQLRSVGVGKFFVWNSCTICNTSLPSHRRNQTKERLITFVEKFII